MSDTELLDRIALRRTAATHTLYAQVCDRIEEMILARGLADETPLMSEQELMARFGVSRGTLRKAMDALEQRGLISREPGRGTFVNPVACLRRIVWRKLAAVAVPDARFDFDFTAFVPDYEGSERSARQLRARAIYKGARTIFAAPDNNLALVRANALADGKSLIVATYAIRRGFVLLENVREEDRRLAATLDGMEQIGKILTLEELAAVGEIDLVVTGAAAVTRDGIHFGKGHGYFDLEWGIMKELMLVSDRTPVVGLVHDCQVVTEKVPRNPFDCTVDLILTPTRALTCRHRGKPAGIFWDRIDAEKLESIPYLAELARRFAGR